MAANGVIEERLDHEISSRPANDDERRRFELTSGVSVLIYRWLGWSSGRPIRYTLEILPADRNVITHVTGSRDPASRNMRIRLAQHSDLPTIMRWRQEAAAWLAAIGSDQ